MYDELVKRLRECTAEQNGEKTLWHQAADAIEGLSASVEGFEAQTNMVLDRGGNNTVIRFEPKWIPVTERLPNGEAERYLVAAPLMSLGLWVSICYYTDNLEEVDEYDFKDEKHSGFYGYDDEYGYYERSGVRYWMPLPQPPEEELA